MHAFVLTDPIFPKMNILKLEDVYDLNVAKYMYALNNGTLHLKLRNTLINNQDNHSHNTRNRLNPHIMTRRTHIACKSIRYNGPKIWYNIPNEIQNLKSIYSFTKRFTLTSNY